MFFFWYLNWIFIASLKVAPSVDKSFNFFSYISRNKSFEKAFRLAIDLNDKDLFLLLQKCAKACNLEDLKNEAKRKADEIFAKEEEEECESHREYQKLVQRNQKISK